MKRTVSFPLGLFCTATMSMPRVKPPETPSEPAPAEEEDAPEDPPAAPGTDGLNDDIYWEE